MNDDYTIGQSTPTVLQVNSNHLVMTTGELTTCSPMKAYVDIYHGGMNSLTLKSPSLLGNYNDEANIGLASCRHASIWHDMSTSLAAKSNLLHGSVVTNAGGFFAFSPPTAHANIYRSDGNFYGGENILSPNSNSLAGNYTSEAFVGFSNGWQDLSRYDMSSSLVAKPNLLSGNGNLVMNLATSSLIRECNPISVSNSISFITQDFMPNPAFSISTAPNSTAPVWRSAEVGCTAFAGFIAENDPKKYFLNSSAFYDSSTHVLSTRGTCLKTSLDLMSGSSRDVLVNNFHVNNWRDMVGMAQLNPSSIFQREPFNSKQAYGAFSANTIVKSDYWSKNDSVLHGEVNHTASLPKGFETWLNTFENKITSKLENGFSGFIESDVETISRYGTTEIHVHFHLHIAGNFNILGSHNIQNINYHG